MIRLILYLTITFNAYGNNPHVLTKAKIDQAQNR
jgi:hypothetical protein